MRRLLTLLTIVAALAVSGTAAGARIDSQVENGGDSECVNGTLYQTNVHKWIAYWDGGGYWRVWSEVFLCENGRYVYVGGFWNS